MQPLYSVDHETRQNSCRREEESSLSNEDTPLLRQFPRFVPEESRRWNPLTILIVVGLVLMLILGIVIGTDLLIILDNSENILPPVETPLQLVSRSQWGSGVGSRAQTVVSMQVSQVIVVQTDTVECHSTATCSSLLQNLQNASDYTLPYNFLVSTNGQTYEALGWYKPSPMFSQYATAMVLAFIGNFTDIAPSKMQIHEAQIFLAESISQRHLTPHYDIIGKNTTYSPEMLFKALRPLPQWNDEWSDA